MAEEEYVRVRFRVAVNTELGDTVHILGDQELGCWDKNKSVVLVTTPASYPIWQTSRPLRLQKGVRLRYRYAIYNAGKFQNWANNTTENSGYHHLTPTLSFDMAHLGLTIDSNVVKSCCHELTERISIGIGIGFGKVRGRTL